MTETTPHTVRLHIAPKSARFAAFLVDLLLWALLAIWIEEAAEPVLKEGDEWVAVPLEFLCYHDRFAGTVVVTRQRPRAPGR
ncbi:hypothetical protein SAMN05444920_1167 [Nonomuraea solani]|uniref:Uncharacterized protein n=1 Tax=Nonomuraea solani TaxID=1144553 RepID=A0A1H6EUB1_9ACTN|nr:hypothetical protein [Nonomuraea solani]SEH00274.1 hypothetical protein SAMN05444920_1167 [Nonomuraea solani]